MNNAIHMRLAALAVALGLVCAAAPARAGNACEMIDADLASEFNGDSAAAGDAALACGFLNDAAGDFSTAIGTNNVTSAPSGTAIGNGNQVSGIQSVAIGTTNIVSGNSSLAIGSGNQATGDVSIAIGDSSAASGAGSIVLGAGSSASADRSAAIGIGSFATAENSVALGAGALADRANTVSVGAAGSERQIANVAAGTQATDAVNLAQMRAGDAQSLAIAKAYTDVRIDRVGALGAAMVGMAASASAVESGTTRIGVAAGTYGGKHALSIGVQRRFGPRVAMTLGGAFSGSERSGTVGVGFGF